LLIQSATEDAERDKAWQEVELAASQPPAPNDVNGQPEALFHFLDKSLLLKHLRELKPDKTVNGKAFYKSYVKWEDLNQTQRNKTISFWVTNLTDGVRFALKQCVEADAANESAEEANRLSITNKHDKARLLHLRIDPSAAVKWSEALREKSRVQLDDRDGQGGYVCPFDSLASLFNDPTNIYENACVVPDKTDESGCYVPESGMEMVARRCYDINPSAKNRPTRDGAWIRAKWKELKSKLTVYHADFMRSGNQDAENLTDEWCTFLERRGGVEDVYFYAFTIFNEDDFNYLGKALPKEVQMDTGALDESETLEDRVVKEIAKRKERSEARKHQRAAKKLKEAKGLAEVGDDVSGFTPSISSSTQLLSSTLSARFGEFNQIEERKAQLKEKESENRSALEIIQCAIQFGNSSQKALGTQLLNKKLNSLKETLDNDDLMQELESVDLEAQLTDD
jgi:hypothetical protein